MSALLCSDGGHLLMVANELRVPRCCWVADSDCSLVEHSKALSCQDIDEQRLVAGKQFGSC